MGLIVLVLVYLIVIRFRLTTFHLQTVINQVAVLAVLSTGAIFIFSLGSFDISLGVSTGTAATLGVLAYNAGAGIFGLIAVCLGVGFVIGTINSTLSAVLKLPVFIMTIAMMSVLTAVTVMLMNGQTNLYVANDLKPALAVFDNAWIRVAFVFVFFVICLVLFSFSKVGKRNKIIGGSVIVARQSGISVTKQTIITFLISGVGVGLAAFLLLTRAPSVSTATGASLGMDVLMAVVFGGMPLSGGAHSKVTAGLVGSFSMVLFNQILVILSIGSGEIQIYKAVLFLVVVFAASTSYRGKLLAR
jgi:ribose transport system permease protein